MGSLRCCGAGRLAALSSLHCTSRSRRGCGIPSDCRSSRRGRLHKFLAAPLAAAGDGDVVTQNVSEGGVSLGTARLPDDVNLRQLESLLYQWANDLTANGNLPLPIPIKVDKKEGGISIGFVRLRDGRVEAPVSIDISLSAAGGGRPAMFRAVRTGASKDQVPPGEPIIMQSLLQALKMAIPLARPPS